MLHVCLFYCKCFNLQVYDCSGLKNDHVAETFYVKHKIDNNYFPCRYVKICKYIICQIDAHLKHLSVLPRCERVIMNE